MIIDEKKNIKSEFYSYQISENKKYPKILLLHVIWLRYKYGVNINEYFDYHLYDIFHSHDDFYCTTSCYKHSWKAQRSLYMKDKPLSWRILHHLDFLLCKIIYPGIDATDYFIYEFPKYRYSVRKTFITEGYLRKLNSYFNGNSGEECTRGRQILNNKVEFNTFFSDYIHRDWVNMKIASYEQFLSFCEKHHRIIIKPSGGDQGKGIEVVDVSSDGDITELYNRLNNKDYIIEEILVQHNELAAIYPSFLNTLRINTIKKDDIVYVVSAAMRIGRAGSVIDNYSAGGIAASIDVVTGKVNSRAITKSGIEFFIHPDSGTPIIGFQYPQWDKIVTTVKETHQRIPGLRYIGWDVAVLNNGEIALVEANNHAGVSLVQQTAMKGLKKHYDDFR